MGKFLSSMAKPARQIWSRLNAALGLGVPEQFGDALTLLQHKRLQQLVPLLYLTIALTSSAAALAAQGRFPVAYKLVLPALLVIASSIRYFMWVMRRGSNPTLSVAKKHLRSTFLITIILCALGGYWTSASYIASGEDVLAPIFMILAAFACVSCLWSLPRAAVASLVVGLGPVTVQMLMSDQIGIVAMACGVILVAIMQARLVFGRFTEMVNNLVLETEMRRLAETDALTGLANRRAFEQKLEAASADAATAPFSIIMIDLDGFKPANDRYGHAAGDAILAKVADRLTALCDSAACLARIGGDEFSLLITGDHSQKSITDLCWAIRTTVSLPYQFDGKIIHISASIGIAHASGANTEPSDLLKAADAALYRDKRGEAPTKQSRSRKAA